MANQKRKRATVPPVKPPSLRNKIFKANPTEEFGPEVGSIQRSRKKCSPVESPGEITLVASPVALRDSASTRSQQCDPAVSHDEMVPITPVTSTIQSPETPSTQPPSTSSSTVVSAQSSTTKMILKQKSSANTVKAKVLASWKS